MSDGMVFGTGTALPPTVPVAPKTVRAPRRKEYEVTRDEAMALYKEMNDRGELPTKRQRRPRIRFEIPLATKRGSKTKPDEHETSESSGEEDEDEERQSPRLTRGGSKVKDGDQSSSLKTPAN